MTRKFKLQPKYVSRKYTHEIKIIPKLTISGIWLKKAGFLPYEIIYVKVEEGRLTITSCEPTE